MEECIFKFNRCQYILQNYLFNLFTSSKTIMSLGITGSESESRSENESKSESEKLRMVRIKKEQYGE